MARKAARANLFEVAGGSTSVTYATTGITGQPSFHFSVRGTAKSVAF
jgi:hypothetical protein